MEGKDKQPQQVLFLNIPQDQTASSLQQQGYSIQQGYPSKEGFTNVPPSYYPPPLQQVYIPGTNVPPVTQQQASNVVVVQSPPTQVVKSTVVRHLSGDHYLTLSITLTFLCVFLGSWTSLFCTIPAIIFAISARDAASRGDEEGARNKGRVALILNIVSVVWWVVVIVIIIIAASVAATTGSDSSYCYYYTRYRLRYSYYSYYYRRYYYYSTYSGSYCYK